MVSESLPDSVMKILSEIGHRLDRDIYPQVLGDGIVMPSDSTASQPIWAEMEHENEKGQRRSATGAWTGSTGRQRPSTGSGTSSPAAPFICSDLKARYESELAEVLKTYPHTRCWHQLEGMWLLSESALLPGLRKKAVFLTGIPFVLTRTVRAWGFWDGIPLAYPIWIGPRHTNGDGSICAFETDGRTWKEGDSLVTLLDLYSTWAVRQLYLQIFGRWPGRQHAQYPYERLLEQSKGELCGCGSDQLYSRCCQHTDLLKIDMAHASEIALRLKQRKPPTEIYNFMRSLKDVPNVIEYLPVCLT